LADVNYPIFLRDDSGHVIFIKSIAQFRCNFGKKDIVKFTCWDSTGRPVSLFYENREIQARIISDTNESEKLRQAIIQYARIHGNVGDDLPDDLDTLNIKNLHEWANHNAAECWKARESNKSKYIEHLKKLAEILSPINLLSNLTTLLQHYLGRLLGYYKPNALDTAILNAFYEKLPAPANEILIKQMKIFNHYHHRRSKAGSVMSFIYFRSFGLKNLDDECKLACYSWFAIPVISAKISNNADNSSPTARADLFIGLGEYYELRIDTPTKKIFGTKKPPVDIIRITDIKVLFDPMNPNPFPSSCSDDFTNLPEWVRNRLANHPNALIKTPLPADLRNHIIDYYDLPFPNDYLELMSYADYIGCHDSFEILGLSRVWSYLTPRQYVIVLGEVFGEGYLALLRNAAPGVYFIDHNLDHIPILMGDSLEKALCRAIDEGADSIIETSAEYNE